MTVQETDQSIQDQSGKLLLGAIAEWAEETDRAVTELDGNDFAAYRDWTLSEETFYGPPPEDDFLRAIDWARDEEFVAEARELFRSIER